MKYFGGVVLLGYLAVSVTGYSPFSGAERGRVPADARRGPGGLLLWTTGFQGGK